MFGLARPVGCRTTLTDGVDSKSETSGATDTRINAVTPARFGAVRSPPSSQGGDDKRLRVMMGKEHSNLNSALAVPLA